MKIQELPYFSQPIYKFKSYGSHLLSESELLAIIIGFGCKGKNVLELSDEIYNLLFEMGYQNVTIEDLTKIKGVSEKKAMKVIAILELTKKFSALDGRGKKIILKDEQSIFKWAFSQFSQFDREVFVAAFIDHEHRLQGTRFLSYGGEDEVDVHIKNFLKDILLGPSSRVILLHNHLENYPKTSKEDIETNKILTEKALSIGVKITKHIIVGKKGCSIV